MLHLVYILLGDMKHVDVVASCFLSLPPAAVHTCDEHMVWLLIDIISRNNNNKKKKRI